MAIGRVLTGFLKAREKEQDLNRERMLMREKNIMGLIQSSIPLIAQEKKEAQAWNDRFQMAKRAGKSDAIAHAYASDPKLDLAKMYDRAPMQPTKDVGGTSQLLNTNAQAQVNKQLNAAAPNAAPPVTDPNKVGQAIGGFNIKTDPTNEYWKNPQTEKRSFMDVLFGRYTDQQQMAEVTNSIAKELQMDPNNVLDLYKSVFNGDFVFRPGAAPEGDFGIDGATDEERQAALKHVQQIAENYKDQKKISQAQKLIASAKTTGDISNALADLGEPYDAADLANMRSQSTINRSKFTGVQAYNRLDALIAEGLGIETKFNRDTGIYDILYPADAGDLRQKVLQGRKFATEQMQLYGDPADGFSDSQLQGAAGYAFTQMGIDPYTKPVPGKGKPGQGAGEPVALRDAYNLFEDFAKEFKSNPAQFSTPQGVNDFLDKYKDMTPEQRDKFFKLVEKSTAKQ